MSVESAKAFCVRMMSDDEFRDSIGCATSGEAIEAIVKGEHYDFKKDDLRKVVGDILGKKISAEELTAMICDVYESEIKGSKGTGSAQAVADWLNTLA